MNCREETAGFAGKLTFSHVIITAFMLDDIRQDNNLYELERRREAEENSADTKITILIFTIWH